MPDSFVKIFEHAPDLLLMLVLVFLFLKFTNRLLDSHSKRTDEFIDAVKDINADHATALHDMRSAIDRQALAAEGMQQVLRDNTAATREQTAALRKS